MQLLLEALPWHLSRYLGMIASLDEVLVSSEHCCSSSMTPSEVKDRTLLDVVGYPNLANPAIMEAISAVICTESLPIISGRFNVPERCYGVVDRMTSENIFLFTVVFVVYCNGGTYAVKSWPQHSKISHYEHISGVPGLFLPLRTHRYRLAN